MPYENIKPEIIASLNRYAEEHIPTGGFLRSVLSNDLMAACATADDDNLPVLPEIVKYCYNELPGSCWGSAEKVWMWLNHHRDPMAGELRVTKVEVENVRNS